jgi:predicted peptidase
VAALADIAADPARRHGFDVWKINSDWWIGLHLHLGEEQADYQRLVHLPDGYDKDKKAWPLLLFLHGAGGDGKNMDSLKNDGPLGYINQGHPLPFIVVSPLCSPHEGWNPARLAHLIDEISSTYRVDPKRIYLTGLSMGGDGAWNLAASYPDKFAAIAPVSGAENPDIAERLKKMPAWIFHGSEDAVVFTRYDIGIAQAMQKLGAPVKLTIYPGIGHGGWATTYDNPELYAWFLQHSR